MKYKHSVIYQRESICINYYDATHPSNRSDQRKIKQHIAFNNVVMYIHNFFNFLFKKKTII